MKKRKSLKELGIAIFSIILITSFIQSDLEMNSIAHAASDSDEDYKIVGYYPSWAAYGRDFQVTDMDASKVTHINYAFADICWEGKHGNPDPASPNSQTWSCEDETGVINAPNGTIVLGDPWIDIGKSFPGDNWGDPIKGNLNQLKKLKEINPNLKTIISVGGWSWSNRFSDVAANPSYRENFANSAVDFIRTYDMDGVDLDWEYPVEGGLPGNSVRPDDGANHVLLLQAVRDKLDEAEIVDNKEYYLTIASNAGPGYAKNNDLGDIGQVVDWINVMTYDFNGGWQTVSAHNAPLYFDQKAEDNNVPNADNFNIAVGIQGHLDAGVPSNKIVLGTPFYGRGWGGCDGVDNGEYQECTGMITDGTWENGIFNYSDLAENYINKNGYTRYWNDTAKVPYLYNSSNGNYISYDDTESFTHKIDFIKTKGLGGAMFWDYSSDRQEVLLDALNDNLTGTVVSDNEAPTVPTNLIASDLSAKSLKLTWHASTDNIGVSSYLVSYGSKTMTVTTPEAVVTSLLPDTNYTFTVQAKDAAGNLSELSNELSITTLAASDTVAPTTPTDVVVKGKTDSSVTLSWQASTDNIGVTSYNVSFGTDNIVVQDNTVTITNLAADTSYTFSITAVDAEDNISDAAIIEVTTNKSSVCTGLEWESTIVYTSGNKVNYNGKLFEAKWWTQGDIPDPTASANPWKYIEDCGNNNGNDNGDNNNNNDNDTEAPTAPTNLSATSVTANSITLSWDASTDNKEVTGYVVRNDSQILETDQTSITINSLSTLR